MIQLLAGKLRPNPFLTPAMLILAVASLSAPARATDVTNETQLREAIFAGDSTINLLNTITLTQSLPMITSNATINGNGFTIDANNAGRVFFVQSGTVTISNVTVANALAKGGDAGAGGGGGLGAGAAVFVNTNAHVSLTNLQVTNARAVGGTGGGGGCCVADFYGGGGGLGGNAGAAGGGYSANGGGGTTSTGSGGGGGEFGAGASGVTGGGAGGGGGRRASGGLASDAGGGGGGGLTGAGGASTDSAGGGGGGTTGAGTGSASGGAGGVANGGNGGTAGTAGANGGAGGGGGGGAMLFDGGNGGAGGGGGGARFGGNGGNGGFGGGGGGSAVGNGGHGGTGGGGGAGLFRGGNGGDFGGGGGAFGDIGGTPGVGGNGGFGGGGGGGTGGAGGFGAGGGSSGAAGAFGGSNGGGGAALGGAVFVREGGTLTINDGTFGGTYSTNPGGGAQAQGAIFFLHNTASATLDVSAGNTRTIAYNDAIAGDGNLTKSGSGVLVLGGANSNFVGSTTINAGTLQVDGSIASSSLTSVNTGALLTGVGAVGNLQVNAGGAFQPGNRTAGSSMLVAGNLVMQAAATYLVQVNSTTASFATVTGTAAPNGATVSLALQPGVAPSAFINRQYTILSAALGVTNAFNPNVITNNVNLSGVLSYTANDVFLTMNLNFGLPGALNGNQQAVGNALTTFFNANGGIPAAFAQLTQGQLTQSDGESGTGSQQTTFNAMNQFMGVLTDQSIAGRGDSVSGGGVHGYAGEQALGYSARRNRNDALAAIYTKAPPPVPSFEQRWSVWAAGYGGSQTTSGNAVAGSHNSTSSIYGTAVGADYRLSPDTLAGFALAGGGTNFAVANALGSGRSDLFQAGAFIRHTRGAAYLSGALAYGWQDITTNRTLTIAGIDQLRAQFNANAWSGRVEGGYRFVSQGFGWTPYAAGQFTTFNLPNYAERAIAGANTFALAYNSKSVTDTRSELGLRTDKSFAAADGVITLRGRLAWAHDYNPDRAIGATFQTLPGASFVVNGPRQASESALVTASAEKKWLNGWSAAATFEGEFSNVTASYAGKAVARYAW